MPYVSFMISKVGVHIFAYLSYSYALHIQVIYFICIYRHNTVTCTWIYRQRRECTTYFASHTVMTIFIFFRRVTCHEPRIGTRKASDCPINWRPCEMIAEVAKYFAGSFWASKFLARFCHNTLSRCQQCAQTDGKTVKTVLASRFPSRQQPRQHALSRSRLLHTSRPLGLPSKPPAAKASVLNGTFVDDVAYGRQSKTSPKTDFTTIFSEAFFPKF